MDPMQPWVRLEKLEGMEDKDGQKIGLPDLPKGTRQEGHREGWQQKGRVLSLSKALGCGEKEIKISVSPSLGLFLRRQ